MGSRNERKPEYYRLFERYVYSNDKRIKCNCGDIIIVNKRIDGNMFLRSNTIDCIKRH